MSRILAIDYGSKRIGIAVTDVAQIIATGLTTVTNNQVFAFLSDYFSKEEVECIVVGEPKHLDNTPAQAAAMADKFCQNLIKHFPDIPVKRVDERFTSKMAFQAMIDGGMKKKDRRNKAKVDEISAVIILQSYLEQIKK